MKTTQLQKAIITDLTKRTPVRWLVGRYEGRAALTDGCRMHLLRDEDLYINPDRLAALSDTAMETIMNGDKAGDLHDLTYISSHKGEGGAGAYDLYGGDDFEIALNPILLKYFEGYELKSSGEHEPVYVYELDKLVGLVLPIRRTK